MEVQKKYEVIIQEINASSQLISEKIDLSLIDKFCIQVIWQEVLSFTGSMYLEISNNDSIYSKIDETEITISGTDSFSYNVPDSAYRFVRIVFNIDSGSCNVFADVNAKGW